MMPAPMRVAAGGKQDLADRAGGVTYPADSFGLIEGDITRRGLPQEVRLCFLVVAPLTLSRFFTGLLGVMGERG